MPRAAPVAATVRIETLPGVGPALAQRIRAIYGSDEAFLDACQRLDIDRLLDLEGLSERRALSLVAAVRTGNAHDLARTERAAAVRRELEDLLASYANTEYARRYVRMLPPLHDANAIQQRVARVMASRDLVESVDRQAVRRQLARLARLREATRPSGVRRLVIAESEDEELQLRERGIDRWCRVTHGREAFRDAEDYDIVLVASESAGAAARADGHVLVIAPDAAPWEFVPETETAFVDANRATLEAMAELARLLQRPTAATSVLEAAVAAPVRTSKDIEKAAHAALQDAQAAFEAAVGDLHLEGRQILEFLSQGTSRALDAPRRTALDTGRRRFRELTGLVADVLEDSLPLTLDEAEVRRLRDNAVRDAHVEAFQRAQSAARAVQAAREDLRRELSAWFDFDVEFALGSYAADHDAQPARTSHRLRLRDGVHVRLRGQPGVQPVSYELGGDQSVAVLTGANSGGKSTLLELLAQTVLLHHWGLPVPAQEAEVPLVDDVLFFGATRGLDAGAFETFLRELFPPLVSPGRKLVLLDEVESVTELEAAGRILGVFLDEVARTDSLCLLVTHLPDDVLRHAHARVRIDGIDAVGLDEKFNLIVDRQPKLGHRARSTPELILRRVHAKSTGAVQEVYAKILSRWA